MTQEFFKRKLTVLLSEDAETYDFNQMSTDYHFADRHFEKLETESAT